MEKLYDVNGLMFWSDKEIRLRRYFEEQMDQEVRRMLLAENKAWQFTRIEAPLLMPAHLMNPNYTSEDVWMQETKSIRETGQFFPETRNPDGLLVLRPETTPSSYAYAQHMLNSYLAAPPFVVYQAGKSFRREQDQVTKNMRLKEFYQMEFQCIYSADTMNDYQEKVLQPLADMFAELIGLPSRIVESDRLPDYSLRTMDVEVDNGDKWMEVCSISKRKDFPQQFVFTGKNGNTVKKDALVLEIAIGLDRCVYNYFQKPKNN